MGFTVNKIVDINDLPITFKVINCLNALSNNYSLQLFNCSQSMESLKMFDYLNNRWLFAVQCLFPLHYICTIMTSIKIFVSFKKPSEKEVKNAQIHLKACVERTAYVPGETIVFNGLVKTLGGSTIQRTSLTFIQVDSFMDSSRGSAESRLLQVVTLCSNWNRCTKSWAIFKSTRTASVSGDEWNGIKITIPPVAPTSTSSIIDIQYFIQVYEI